MVAIEGIILSAIGAGARAVISGKGKIELPHITDREDGTLSLGIIADMIIGIAGYMIMGSDPFITGYVAPDITENLIELSMHKVSRKKK